MEPSLGSVLIRQEQSQLRGVVHLISCQPLAGSGGVSNQTDEFSLWEREGWATERFTEQNVSSMQLLLLFS